MIISDLTKELDLRFPLALQEKYDNAGDQVCFGHNKINGVLLSLDIDESVIDEAAEKQANLIISHHPFFFKPLSRIRTGEPSSELLLRLIQNEISLYSAHTNLDKIYFNKLGRVLGLVNYELLVKTDVADGKDYGYGICGDLPGELKLDDILALLKTRLGIEYLIYSGDKKRKIKRIAMVGGAGGSMIEKILKEREIHCVITGDIGYHHCKTAAARGVPVIDAGHYGTERILLTFLKDEIEDCLTNLEKGCDVMVHISEKEENPFKVYI
ncbi:MAG: Nif3-like dinuclear metal center hexameric protein [Spirochaetes bacterium]|nr:Nif3-like dinuclear metal center hexameric protein [Spirochaetota bacterium]